MDELLEADTLFFDSKESTGSTRDSAYLLFWFLKSGGSASGRLVFALGIEKGE